MERQGVVREFGAMSFIWRFAASMLLVFATYNPTDFSYYSWLRNGFTDDGLGPEHFVVGIVLIIGWSIFVVATQRSLGTVGSVLAAALIGGIIWWLTDLGWLAVGSVSALTWVSIICLSLLLAVGLSWSHIWRRLTGQYEVDDTDG
ncbi:MAG TPA: DUF6524 family protein [Gammaproteobacteria bacterium]|jgi:hypothetical protein